MIKIWTAIACISTSSVRTFISSHYTSLFSFLFYSQRTHPSVLNLLQTGKADRTNRGVLLLLLIYSMHSFLRVYGPAALGYTARSKAVIRASNSALTPESQPVTCFRPPIAHATSPELQSFKNQNLSKVRTRFRAVFSAWTMRGKQCHEHRTRSKNSSWFCSSPTGRDTVKQRCKFL